MTAEETGLPAEVRTVLLHTAEIAVSRTGGSTDPEALLGSATGVRALLPLLRSGGLRKLLRTRFDGELSTPAAQDLLAADDATAERAAAHVSQLLDQARKAQRRASRAARRAQRPDAETKRAQRHDQKVVQLRATRDRLETRLGSLQDENRELRATVDNLDAEAAQLRRHLDVAYARLERVQSERDNAIAAERQAPTVSVGEDLSVSVRVLGGGGEIGGSAVLVSGGGTRVLVDAGTRPSGVDTDSLAPAEIGWLNENPPDAIVVTHAHNDHAGWVPALSHRFPGIPVLASPATCDLLGTMWGDAAKVLARKADSGEAWAGGPLPPYQQSDVDSAVSSLVDLPAGRHRRVGALGLEFFDAGHIVGACGVVITAGPTRIVITGDVSGPGQFSVGGLRLPESAHGAQLMLLESTYAGAGKLPPRDTVIDQFVSDADRILGAGGRVLVPAFALGRAQEIALLCQRHLPEAEVLVDGLARDLSHAYRRHDGPDGERVEVFRGNVRPVEPGRTRREIATRRPCIVVATSGMLTGGPAVAWASDILTEPQSGLMVVGYQDADSPGSRLLGLAADGGGRFELPGTDEPITVAAHVGQYRLGAHATEDELVDIAARAKPETLMLVHGRAAAQRSFAKRMRLREQHTVLAEEPWYSQPE